MWVICKATLGRGRNKLLIRGAEEMKWIFCPLIKGIKRDKILVDKCQACKHFVQFQQTRIFPTHTTRKHLSFNTRTQIKDKPHIARSLGLVRARHQAKPPSLPWIDGEIKERKPIIDIFEEKDYVMVVTELPHINEKDLNIKMDDDAITISANNATTKYIKKVALPASIKKDAVKFTYRNGILEVKMNKAG